MSVSKACEDLPDFKKCNVGNRYAQRFLQIYSHQLLLENTAKLSGMFYGKRMYFKFPDVRYQLANKNRNSIFAEKRTKTKSFDIVNEQMKNC